MSIHFPAIRPWATAATFSVLLGACGGGEGGGGGSAPEIDRTPRLERFVGVIAAADGPIGVPLEFFLAGDIAADRNGNLYTAYGDNAHRITPEGQVTRLASALSFTNGVAVDDSGNAFLGHNLPGSNRGAYIPPRATIRRIGPQGETDLLPLNGSGNTPILYLVSGLALDSSGNIYIADLVSDLILRLGPGGNLVTLAGVFGVQGGTDGPAGGATFHSPEDLVVDASRNVFVSDKGNNAIRRISPDGVVSTYAGRIGIAGHADGPAAAAMFDTPSGMALDPAGNLYVADSQNHVVRKITPSGIVSTVAGTPGVKGFVPGALPGVLNAPQGVAIVGDNLFITMLTGIAVVRNRP